MAIVWDGMVSHPMALSHFVSEHEGAAVIFFVCAFWAMRTALGP